MISILATVDGSDEALTVIPAVQKLAAGQEANVRLLMVVDRPAATIRRSGFLRRSPTAPAEGVPGAPMNFGPVNRPDPQWAETDEQALQRAVDEGRDYLESVASDLRKGGAKVEIEVTVNDDPSRAIIDCARERKPDVIAMATHGRSGLSSLVQGSVATAVVRAGVAPVLQVRPSGK